MKLGIIGAGKWGSALHFALSKKNDVYITSRHHHNLKNFVSLEEILNLEYLILVLPAQVIGPWLEKHPLKKDHKVLLASKGIDIRQKKFLNEILQQFLPQEHIAVLSGPSFAAEVQKGLPTAVVVSSCNEALAKTYAQTFPDFMKAYVDDDVIGAEIAGAYKNVIAIASGICDGLQLGNNARAALLARGLVEMERFASRFGAKMRTFLGLSGAGDLFLTASSTLSRNYRVGLGLASRKDLDMILHDLGEVAEGVYTVEAIIEIAKEHSIYVPIAHEVYEILHGKDPKLSIIHLLERNSDD
ncbi:MULTISPECIES: NAD(P)H-dependent glycerol-3-phosphate dehydrogenase [unclassified Nitratiruptor]|uniref:NAD(P)H-dependent glycerol-3-phosphate dehydrogenase n=1 Tax=unclassified Nitratiruptor TaxID=2624044 RepID=UPI001914E947|nr:MULTISPECIES: NAD(P)H-dependent glycerol-3-phosphate dehydrogenase [unclassified Nitratiruptor]BCD60420.1 glycerol-3-phosphate dehydrogenase (NAD(P)+) [Nitratiruptor sp. YY08-10]BCD64091.1 glycerol-3-phosphate dehydrogenase (NAD(P)+) [Nitratiruptor sp. YY08-14]